MYKQLNNQMSINVFKLPFEGNLQAKNRCVQMTKIIQWDKIEKDYYKLFPNNIGQANWPARMVLEALIIKVKLKLSDEETALQIAEKPYLQYFTGFKEYNQELPFGPSLMDHFRKRFVFRIVEHLFSKSTQS